MPIQIDELVIKAEKQIDQQAETNKQLAEVNQTLAAVAEAVAARCGDSPVRGRMQAYVCTAGR